MCPLFWTSAYSHTSWLGPNTAPWKWRWLYLILLRREPWENREEFSVLSVVWCGLRKYKEAEGIHFMESTLFINAPKALEDRVRNKSQQFSPAALLHLLSGHKTPQNSYSINCMSLIWQNTKLCWQQPSVWQGEKTCKIKLKEFGICKKREVLLGHWLFLVYYCVYVHMTRKERNMPSYTCGHKGQFCGVSSLLPLYVGSRGWTQACMTSTFSVIWAHPASLPVRYLRDPHGIPIWHLLGIRLYKVHSYFTRRGIETK